MINLPDPVDPASDESAVTAYAARLSVACAPIMTNTPGCDLLEPIDQARIWQIYPGNVELDDETRADLAQRSGQKIRDDAAARQALALWRSVEAWHTAHIRRDPRYALRCLMSDLSEEATCASWHYDTEFALWELLNGARTSWMRLGKSDSRIIDLRRLHEKTGGWYRFDEAADGGWGQKIFVDKPSWLSIYRAAVDDPDRAHFAVVDGKPRRGQRPRRRRSRSCAKQSGGLHNPRRNSPMTTWFTSDTHFGHARVIELNKRPYSDVTEMDEAMIAAWNARVRPDDVVWHLGDFALGRDEKIEATFHRLTGVKHLVIGNHDEDNEAILTLPWASISQIATTIVDGQRIAMCHYLMKSWPHARKGAIHLFGHMHRRIRGTKRSLDVGVDCWAYQPVSLAEIGGRLKTLPDDPELPDAYFAGQPARGRP